MDERPRAVLLKFPGTNCDRETARALRIAGFEADVLPFSRVEETTLETSDLLVFSGGFSYGDYVKAGRLARLEIEAKLGTLLEDFKRDGGSILGICNGFQILLELGLLPEGSLVQNRNRRFLCQWVRLELGASNPEYFDRLPERFELPIAHMEGRFVTSDEKAEDYLDEGLVPLKYVDNPNGSEAAVAGLQDGTGRVLGIMPHPERFLRREHHYSPEWDVDDTWGWGYAFFRSAFESVRSSSASRNRTLTTFG